MTTIPDDMIERAARALREADIIWGSRRYPEKSVKEIRDLVEDASDDLGYEGLARAAIEAMQPAILAAEKRGEERERDKTKEMHRRAQTAEASIDSVKGILAEWQRVLGEQNNAGDDYARRNHGLFQLALLEIVKRFEKKSAAIRKGSDQ